MAGVTHVPPRAHIARLAAAERGNDTGRILRIIDGELVRARSGWSGEEVERARSRAQLSIRSTFDELTDAALHLGIRTPTGVAPTLEYEIARYAEVTRDSVIEVMRTHLPPSRRLVVFVASNPSAPPEGTLVSVREL